MPETGVRKLIFSSSATAYGETQFLPLKEDHPLSAINPYGRTKLIVVGLLCDLFAADPGWHIGILRYFKPVGAHESELIGEGLHGIPNNLIFTLALRRSGDVAACYTYPSHAKEFLKWRATRNFNTLCADTWCWYDINPKRYLI